MFLLFDQEQIRKDQEDVQEDALLQHGRQDMMTAWSVEVNREEAGKVATLRRQEIVNDDQIW